jgi:hypothetical protein
MLKEFYQEEANKNQNVIYDVMQRKLNGENVTTIQFRMLSSYASHSGRLQGEGGSEQSAEENNYTCELRNGKCLKKITQ